MNMNGGEVILYLVKLLTNTNYNNPHPITPKKIDMINAFPKLNGDQDTSTILRNSFDFEYNIKINNNRN